MATRASYATKLDVSEVRDEVRIVRGELHEVRGELHEVHGELHEVRDTLRGEIGALRGELHVVRDGLRGELHDFRDELKADIRAVGVMVESLRSNMSTIAEAFSTVARKSEVAEVDDRLSARTALLEDSVRELAADVRKAQRAGGKR